MKRILRPIGFDSRLEILLFHFFRLSAARGSQELLLSGYSSWMIPASRLAGQRAIHTIPCGPVTGIPPRLVSFRQIIFRKRTLSDTESWPPRSSRGLSIADRIARRGGLGQAE